MRQKTATDKTSTASFSIAQAKKSSPTRNGGSFAKEFVAYSNWSKTTALSTTTGSTVTIGSRKTIPEEILLWRETYGYNDDLWPDVASKQPKSANEAFNLALEAEKYNSLRSRNGLQSSKCRNQHGQTIHIFNIQRHIGLVFVQW
ncbi:unnamed protein product [Caenorhabditis brenneri]